MMGIRILISQTNEALVEGCYSGGKNCHGVLCPTVFCDPWNAGMY